MSSSSSSGGTNSSNSSGGSSNSPLLDANAAAAAAAALLDTKPLIQSVSNPLDQQPNAQSQQPKQGKQITLMKTTRYTEFVEMVALDVLVKPEQCIEVKPEETEIATEELALEAEPPVGAPETPGPPPAPAASSSGRKLRGRAKAVAYGSTMITLISTLKSSPEVPATKTVHRTTLRSLASAAAATAAGLLAPSPTVSVLNESKVLQRRVSAEEESEMGQKWSPID